MVREIGEVVAHQNTCCWNSMGFSSSHANYHLLIKILKEKYGFQGFALSDWMRGKSLEILTFDY
jgi:beta-glucosidase-like glycosyl hydrolase